MTLSLLLKGISVPKDRMRKLNPEKVDELAESIARFDLQSPIIVRSDGGMGHRLISGLHRLKAFEKLGLDTIPAECRDVSDDEARLIEITENLHRAELNHIERGEHMEAWKKYLEENPRRLNGNGSDGVLGQLGPKPTGNPSSETNEGGRPPGGVRQLARDLNLDRKAVDRGLKIASLDQRVKDAALVSGIGKLQRALLSIVKAKEEGASIDEQVEIAKKWADKREKDNSRPTKSPKARRKDPAQDPEDSHASENAKPEEDIPTDESVWVAEGSRWHDRGRPEWRLSAMKHLFGDLLDEFYREIAVA